MEHRVVRQSAAGVMFALALGALSVEAKDKVGHLKDLTCAQDQVAKFNGGQWQCAEDTNAATICEGAKILNGNGVCVDQVEDTNAATKCASGELLGRRWELFEPFPVDSIFM
jgi:hypothetical protein